MKEYLRIVDKVLQQGVLKTNRTGVDTLFMPNMHFSHNMQDGFPALTTKRLAFKTLSVELEGFIHGITSKKWYQDRNCHIWDSWANPVAVEEQLEQEPDRETKDLQYELDDLGPIYGCEWRQFNHVYNGYGCLYKYDQFDYVVQTLKTNPNDRRMVVSAWNPQHINQQALPPCHVLWTISHCNGKLNLHWTQRSCDLFLGVPFNIASYALLLELLCKESNMVPGNLSGMLCDCHIYTNSIKQLEEQLLRNIKPLPTLEIGNWDGIYNWTHEDSRLINYNPHNKLTAEVAV